jgi:hypothetical protein
MGMDDTDQRIDDVRGEPLDELRFLTQALVGRLQHTLPDDFWQHVNLARKEMRLALVILLRAAIDHLAREDADKGDSGPVSAQRGKIVLEPVETLAPSPNGHAVSETPSVTKAVPGDKVSGQRGKITLG